MEHNQLNNQYVGREEFRDLKSDFKEVSRKVDDLPQQVSHIVSTALEPLITLQRQQNGRVGKLEDAQRDRDAKEQAIKWLFRGVWGVAGAIVVKLLGLF